MGVTEINYNQKYGIPHSTLDIILALMVSHTILYCMHYLSDGCDFVGRRRSNAQNASCPNAVLRESNGDLTSPGMVTAGAEVSRDSPFESRNYVKKRNCG